MLVRAAVPATSTSRPIETSSDARRRYDYRTGRTVNRTLASLLVAIIAASLWLLWNLEHEHTSIRAPWTGLTLAASAVAFVTSGVLGRGWRALACAAVAAAVAVVLVDPLIWKSEPAGPVTEESCDPGCISLEVAVGLSGVAAAVLATLGILLRRVLSLVGSPRSSTAA